MIRKHRSDWWAVGALVILIVTGILLFGWLPELMGLDLWP